MKMKNENDHRCCTPKNQCSVVDHFHIRFGIPICPLNPSHRKYCWSVALPSLGSLSLCHSACTGCCCSILLCREHERLVATTCGSLSLVQSFCLALCGQWIGLYRHHMRNMPIGLLSLFTCGEVLFESMWYLAYRHGFDGTGSPLTDLKWVFLHYVALLWLLL